MAYTFDGPNRLIILSTGTTAVEVVDLYSRWVDWLLTSDHSKYALAFRSVGGDPLPGSKALGLTFFLMSGWKIRPQESSHTLEVNGNLYCEDGSSPYVPTLGPYTVAIISTVSSLPSLLSGTGGLSKADVDAAVWTESIRGQEVISDAHISRAHWTNRKDLFPGAVSNWVTYNDDGTILMRQDIVDKDGGPITLQPGVPARRSKGI